ncbi:MAG: hypothetical protein JW888_12990 [Pirellulales bacterium]|nr:hypothetical protein [Pirellulales bacterium]
MTYRVWQFLDSDWDYLQRAIPRAREDDMNRIQLGQKIINHAHSLYKSPETLELVRKATRLAHQHGLKVDIWTHELADVPARLKTNGRIVLNDALWAWLRDKYARVFRLVPDVDGLVLTCAESQANIYSDRVISDLPSDARIAKLMAVMADICREHDKMLFVRTFVYMPDELEAMRRAVATIADAVRDKGNVVVMSKCVPHDWSPFYPYSPALGDTVGLPQVVEIDLGEEYTGLSHFLHGEVSYIHAVFNRCRKPTIIGAVARVDRDRGNRALGTPNEVNLHAFKRLAHDRSPTVDQLWTEWAEKRYGREAAPYVIDALKATYDVTNLAFYPLENCMQNHSGLCDWKYALSHITLATPAKWIASPRQELARDELLHPTWITLTKINAEKDAARRLAEASLTILDRGRGHLRPEDYRELRRYLEFGRDVVEVCRYQNLAFEATLRYLNRVQGVDIGHETLEELRLEALKYVDSLDRSADVMENRHGHETRLGNPVDAHKYAAEMRQLIKKASSGKANDKKRTGAVSSFNRNEAEN